MSSFESKLWILHLRTLPRLKKGMVVGDGLTRHLGGYNSLGTPVAGMQVYNSNPHCIKFYLLMYQEKYHLSLL